MATYKRLFEPWELKGHRVANRVCVPALVNFGLGNAEGTVTDAHVERYRTLLSGGAGLVIQEALCVDARGRVDNRNLGIWSDDHIPGLRRLLAVYREHGMPAIAQVTFSGLLSVENFMCPTSYTVDFAGSVRTGREMTTGEMREIERAFVDAGRRVFEAGYDGVEVHACHGYFLSQVLNQRANRRTDEYNARDRLMFRNIVEGIRAATSPEFIIGARLGAFEPTLTDGIENALLAESLGCDFIDSYLGFDWEEDRERPEGYPFNESIYGSQEIKRAVSIPVFSCFGISSGEEAEAILEQTGTDMAVVGRGTLVNPSWAADVAAGRDPGRCLDCKACQWKVPAPCPGRALLERSRA